MNEEIVYIDNMSSPRDILLVSQALEYLGLRVKEIELGAAAYMNPTEVDRGSIGRALENIGYTLIDTEAKLYTEKVRGLVSGYIDNMLRNQQEQALEEYLEQQCKEEFNIISQKFEAITGQRLRLYYKRMRIERVKILLNNTTLSQQEIAEKLDFKNAKNLSRIFKEVTEQPISAYSQRHHFTPAPKFV